MKNLRLFILLLSISSGFPLLAQNHHDDSVMIRSIFDEALVNGQSYENLTSLCLDIGNRLSGSPAADKAVEFSGYAADMWAVGVSLFACLFGILPFYATEPVQLFEMIGTDGFCLRCPGWPK